MLWICNHKVFCEILLPNGLNHVLGCLRHSIPNSRGRLLILWSTTKIITSSVIRCCGNLTLENNKSIIRLATIDLTKFRNAKTNGQGTKRVVVQESYSVEECNEDTSCKSKPCRT